MGWIVISIVALLIIIGLVIGGIAAEGDRSVYLGAAAAVLVIWMLAFFIGGMRIVPVKNVGVITAFGKVEGFAGPGFHHTWPWKSFNLIPETVQTTSFAGGFSPQGVCQALDVRIGGQQQACLDITIQWQVKDQAAAQLFNLYDTSGSDVLADIKNAVVIQELRVAVNQAMGDYNPIQDVALNTAAGNSQFSTFGPKVNAQMERDIGSQISIRHLLIAFAHYDSATQARLNAIQQQYGLTAIALEEIQTNQALAKANAAISRVTGPELIAQCLAIAKEQGSNPGNCITGSAASLAITK